MNRLDSDLLRTFLAIADAGSVTGGAARIHRSQSATSSQIKLLEGIVGRPLFERHGRGVVLSSAGEALAPTARQVVAQLDRALADLTLAGLEGKLRIGIADDQSRGTLAKILAAFAREHPRVELTVHCALSAGFSKALASGALDLAVHEVQEVSPAMALLREEPLHWVRHRAFDPLDRDPLPVAIFDRACWWRDLALAALRDMGRPYRIVYSSESVLGIAAAIEAGIAVGLLSASALGKDMVVMSRSEGFRDLPVSKLVLEQGRDAAGPLSQAMTAAILQAFAASPLS
ncbi:MAG: LysR family transcriptional regulator [Rhodospirillales bacterium]